jgi:DNA-binding NtrC family response regulator
LSTVWGLAQTRGARVGVESLPGEGTTFTIRVPVATETEAAEVESAAVGADGAGQSLRILIVDDEPQILEILPPLLAGHRVETAIGGVDGLKRVGNGDYDILISDWIMAEVSGLEIAQEVKGHAPGTVVILMTGWDFAGGDADPESVVDFVLRKPFDQKAVEQVIDQAAQQLARTPDL